MSVALNFQQTGNLDAPAVVLLGSLGSDLSMWQPQIHALSNRYRVIAVDHRGHGKSPVPAGPYSIADLAGDVIVLLDSLELESVHLVGLSLGGAVSQWIAAHHPPRVETLTLMCTSSQFAPAQPWIDRARAVRADGIASIAAAVVGRWFTPGLAENDPELVARHVAMVEANPTRAMPPAARRFRRGTAATTWPASSLRRSSSQASRIRRRLRRRWVRSPTASPMRYCTWSIRAHTWPTSNKPGASPNYLQRILPRTHLRSPNVAPRCRPA